MKNLLLLLTLLFAAFPAFAQWTTDTEVNTLVAASSTGDLQSAGTSDGKTYIAFWHEVPAPQNYEMRLQLLDANGNRLFGDAGLLVNGTVAMSTFTTIWSLTVDRENNAYVCFNGTGTGNPVHIHKIAPDGTQLWGASGINPGSGFDAKVLPLSNGEVIVCWLPGNKGSMQKFSADGTAVWAAPVTIEPAVANHRTSAGELAEYSNGDFAVVLHDRGGFSPSSLPYVQRYDANGTALWPMPVALTTTYFTVFNRRYSLAQEGDNLYFAYAGAQGIQPHGFLQRINPDGSLPWGTDGVAFSTQTTFFERDVQMAAEGGSNIIWAICEYSNSAQSDVGEYVQKFNKTTGERLLTDLGKEVFPVSADYISHQGKLQVFDNQPFFLVSDGNSNGVFPKDILAVYLDDNGDFAWPEQTRPMGANPEGVKSRIQLNRPADGQLTAVWAENRPAVGESRPYAQNLQLVCNAAEALFTVALEQFSLTLNFFSNASNADTVIWNFGDGSQGTGSMVIHTYAAPGEYLVCQYVSNECSADTLCVLVPVTCALPIAVFSFVPEALEVAFTSFVIEADSLIWDFGDGTTSEEQNPVHTYAAPGDYEVCLYVFNDCGTSFDCAEVSVIANGTHDLKETLRLQVAPNPNSGAFVLHMNLPEAGQISCNLLNATGQVIQSQLLEPGGGEQHIPVSADLPSGLYFIRVHAQGQSVALPFVVK